MSIKISEAAHDENGQLGYEGSIPGDQTGDEVRIREYYFTGSGFTWKYVLRCKDANCRKALAIRARQAAEQPKIGYSQPHRATFVNAMLGYAKGDPSRISTACECDCSSMVSTIAKVTIEAIGIASSINGQETTSAMYSAFMRDKSQMWSDVTSTINLQTGAGLEAGDILLTPGHHTAVVVEVTDDAKTGTVKTTLCLREKPVSGKVIKYLPAGAKITISGAVTASNGATWYKATYDGASGYCSARYVKL